jgi:hypothetical protein
MSTKKKATAPAAKPAAENKPTQEATETRQPGGKYVILKSANHWELDEDKGGLILSYSQKGVKPYVAFANLKKEVKEAVFRAVDYGLLDFTDDPENYDPKEAIKKEQESESNPNKPRYVWNELNRREVKSNRQVPRAPQVTTGSMEYIDKDSKAFKLLRHPAHEVVKRLPGHLSGLSKDDSFKFLKEVFTLETKGINMSMAPRRQVVDAIEEQMLKLGLKPIMLTGVSAEPDPDSDPDKKTRFAL